MNCAPNNANFPATPGAVCNDGNANTKNDVISADGCSCAGTPVVVDPGTDSGCAVLETCGVVTIKQSGSSIIIENLDGQSVVQVFTSSWSPFFNCAWWGTACEGTTTIDDLNVGSDYIVRVGDCTFTVTISGVDCSGGTPVAPVDPCANKGGDANGNGICDDEEVAPPPPPVDPCANKGGDANSNGICDDDEVAPPPPPPAAGDPCSGTIITTGNGEIKISGLDAAPVVAVQVFTPSYQTIHNCWDNACDKPISTIATGGGSFLVFVKYYDVSYGLICQVEETITVNDFAPNSVVSGLVSSTTQTNLAHNNARKQAVNSTTTNSIETIGFDNTNTTLKTTSNVYPNPAFDQLNISLSAYEGQEGELQLLNGIGQIVATTRIEAIDATPIQIGLNQVDAGMYYLQVVVDGALVDLQKVIVEKR